jgi:DUF4097 and DUF4098 domain-containing protein YvlB
VTALLLAASLTFPATPRTTVSIEVGAGDVRITGSSRTDIAVELEAASASVDGDRIVIRADDAGGSPNREARARVDLKVPAGAVFERIRIVDGQLTVEGLRGRIAADVRQGNIRASDISGVLRLETGFGDVTVEGARLPAGGLLRLRAFNGNVRLGLDAQPANARILALTFNGRIDSNVPLNRKESFGPKFAEGTFGSGEPVISLDSVTGNITITAAVSRRR